MMILPIADALMNCLQNLTSRIAGVNNEQMTNKVLGTTAMLGFGLGAIKEQFRTPSMQLTNTNNRNNSSLNSSTNEFKGIISRAKSIVTPTLNLSSEKDYNGDINPIRNVIPKEIPNSTISRKVNAKDNNYQQKSTIRKIANVSLNTAKAYLSLGAKMVEGNSNREQMYKSYYRNKDSKKKAL